VFASDPVLLAIKVILQRNKIVLTGISSACGHDFPYKKSDIRPFAKMSLLRDNRISSPCLASFSVRSGSGYTEQVGDIFPGKWVFR
jgi:hypothetical protein